MKPPMKNIPTLGAERFAELKAKVEAFRKAKAEQLAADQNGDDPVDGKDDRPEP